MIRNARISPVESRANFTNPRLAAFKEKIASPKKKAAKKPSTKKAKAKTTPSALIQRKPVGVVISRKENPDDFTRTLFVLKACSNDKTYEYLTVLHIEPTKKGSRLIATDGRRLHVAEISVRIKGGDYRPVITKDAISFGEPVGGIKFPNWSKVVPGKTRKRGVINLAHTGMGKDRKETDNLSLAFNTLVKQTGEPVNVRYLEDLTKKEWAVYCQGEKQKAIVLKESNSEMDTFAVIMPLAA
jgi:hypothetical protein